MCVCQVSHICSNFLIVGPYNGGQRRLFESTSNFLFVWPFDPRSRKWTMSAPKETSAVGRGWNLYVVETVPPLTLYQEMVKSTSWLPFPPLSRLDKMRQRDQFVSVWSGWIQPALCSEQAACAESLAPPQWSPPLPARGFASVFATAPPPQQRQRRPRRRPTRQNGYGAGIPGELCAAGRLFQQVTRRQGCKLNNVDIRLSSAWYYTRRK